MTTTDRAFIAAIQQASAGMAPMAAHHERESAPAAPHFATSISTADTAVSNPSSAAPQGSRKAPLSEHLARRREATSEAPTPTTERPLRPGVEVESFTWPEMAIELEQRARRPLLDLIARATQRGAAETPAIAMLSARAGVGGSTALLAAARLVAGLGGKVAILDISPLGAASMLGVRRAAHLDDRIGANDIDDLLIASRDGGISVLAALNDEGGKLFAAAFDRLSSTHDLLLIDAGDTGSVASALLSDSFARASLVLVDTADHHPASRAQTVAVLAEAGVPVAGVVETQA